MKVFFALTTAAMTTISVLPQSAAASPSIDRPTAVDRAASNSEVSLTRRGCGARRFSRPRYYRYW